jgi:hypothetical protein
MEPFRQTQKDRMVPRSRLGQNSAQRHDNQAPQPWKESVMAKGEQRSNKEAKKPKKDTGPGKPISPGAVSAAITTVVPDRSKKKK